MKMDWRGAVSRAAVAAILCGLLSAWLRFADPVRFSLAFFAMSLLFEKLRFVLKRR